MNKARRSINSKRPTMLVGSLLLIAVSVAGVFVLVEQNKITESFLITKVDLATGSPVTSEDLVQVEVALASASDNYLRAGQIPADAYLLRPISEGELIPITAITNTEAQGSSNIVITPAIQLSSQIRPGQLVALWASPRLDYSSFGEPIMLANEVEVVQIKEPESGFAGAFPAVEIRVPSEVLEYIIRAVANNDALAVTGTS